MTAAEDAARDALMADVDEQRRDMALVAMVRSEMRMGMREGMRDVLTDPDLWGSVIEVLQKQVAERTGRFILAGVKMAAIKLFWVAIFVAAIYSVAGWSGLKAAASALFGSRS